ncbi:MAG: hypothetical protein NVSMB19_07180 [Vulcanimicrobiaceae bacterium]
MPRPRQPLAEWIAVAVVCAALPPAIRTAALAAAAGTLFEAAPFVLAAALIPPGRGARVLAALGCGCGAGGSGALALPALGICWLAFGPAIALARAVAAVAVRLGVAARQRRRARRTGATASACAAALRPPPDPLAELARLAPQAVAAAFLAEILRATLPVHATGPVGSGAAFAGGALLGRLLPCATGAIAIAAGLRDIAPAATVGLLITAGIVSGRAVAPARDRRDGRLGYAALAVACGLIAWRGPSGFINPRFILPLGGAAAVAGLRAVRRDTVTAVRYPAAVPGLLLAATFAGSPLPDRPPARTTLDAPYAGEHVRFVGALAYHDVRTPATLVRYTITCCRADAEARAVRLDRPLPGRRGAWYEAAGTLGLDPGGAFVLRVATVRPIAAPADPFAYR